MKYEQNITKTFIYALIDPRDNRVRYVGKANDPKKRFIQHCQPSRQSRGNYPVNRWAAKLKSLDLKPRLEILECVEFKDWEQSESKWILYYREKNSDMLNIADGGLGNNKGKKSPGVAKVKSKTYFILGPDQKEIKINNLTQYCKDNKLSVACMWQIANQSGTAKEHKGFTIRHENGNYPSPKIPQKERSWGPNKCGKKVGVGWGWTEERKKACAIRAKLKREKKLQMV